MGRPRPLRPWQISLSGLGLTFAGPEEGVRVGNCCPLTQNEAVERWEIAMSLRETPEENPTGLNGRQDQMINCSHEDVIWKGRKFCF